MKISIPSLIAGLLLCTRLSGANTASPPPNFSQAVSLEIVIEGRRATTPDGSVRLGFSGTVLHLRYHGSALSMRVKATSDEVYFDVSVDQAEPGSLTGRVL
jgi:hypothetical protein